jgi:hypothetical protein
MYLPFTIKKMAAGARQRLLLSGFARNYTNVIYNLCQLIINLTVVNADWIEVLYNAVKLNWTITYFTSVLLFCVILAFHIF